MPNHLINENSPYLLRHINDLVDWYPWGKEALAEAERRNKPIFLNIGYAASHLCYRMEQESFEDTETAALLNQNFVSIKVDREERPDLDNIYMQATSTITGSRGWPMSVFLTPDLRPFYAGTYFPPARHQNIPSFKEVLVHIIKVWRERRDEVDRVSKQVLQRMQPPILNKSGNPFASEALEAAAKSLLESYDWENGGWGAAPKFPQSMTIEFLLRRALTNSPHREQALKVSRHALNAMSLGGMYDVVGGGFAHCSVDNFWRRPLFEKMLCDNAQLAAVYLHAYLVTCEEKYRWVCKETLDFLLREMSHPGGGFYSSLDSDSDGEEGKFYLWTHDQIEAVLGSDFGFFKTAYGITSGWNWQEKTILQRSFDDSVLAVHFKIDPKIVHLKLAECHSRLLAARNLRNRPATDDKILVMSNALAFAAFAEAGRYLKRKDYVNVAIRCARFLLDNLYVDGRLLRSWRNGQAKHNAYLEDYASLILALLSLYQSDPNTLWYTTALTLADQMVAHFSDPAIGFFDTRNDHEMLLFRPKNLQDQLTPSGNALAATALLQLAAYADRAKWRSKVLDMLSSIQSMALRYPTAFAQWLSAVDFAIGPTGQVVVIGNPDNPKTQELLETLWKSYRPRQVVAISAHSSERGVPAILKDHPLFNDQPTAYVFQGALRPQAVSSPQELEIRLTNNSVQ